MTTAMPSRVWDELEGDYVTKSYIWARNARSYILAVQEAVSHGDDFVNSSRSSNRCASWGEYLYKLARNHHRARRPFHCHIKNEALVLEPDDRQLLELIGELLYGLNDKSQTHATACQILVNERQ